MKAVVNSKNGVLVALLALGAAIAVPVALQAQSAQGTVIARTTLKPLNGSQASGSAELRLSSDRKTLTVHLVASGLEAGGVHLSHIHGLSANGKAVDSTCPTIAQDIDGDGYVELAEGQVKYGPILVDFMNVDPDADGRVDFSQTFDLGAHNAALPLQMRHIVIHGESVPAGAGANSTGPAPNEVDGTGGFKVLLPVLCGEIRAGQDPMTFRRL